MNREDVKIVTFGSMDVEVYANGRRYGLTAHGSNHVTLFTPGSMGYAHVLDMLNAMQFIFGEYVNAADKNTKKT